MGCHKAYGWHMYIKGKAEGWAEGAWGTAREGCVGCGRLQGKAKGTARKGRRLGIARWEGG